MGWSTEVYVKTPTGTGRLDLYDVQTNTYYEVKSKRASTRSSTEVQMKNYDASVIASKKLDSCQGKTPTRGNEYVSGSFAYGMYDVHYKTQASGLIVYDTEVNYQRTLQTAVILVLILGLATGNVGVAAGAAAALSAI